MKNEITPAIIDAIKTNHPLLATVSGHAQGEKQINGRTWWSCPFHLEKTPSFSLVPNGQSFVCFGCGARGDVLDFVGRVKGLKFNEVVALLRSGDSSSTSVLPQHDPAITARRKAERLAEENRKIKLARTIWENAAPAPGTVVETYLNSRGLTLPVPPSLRYADLKHAPTGLVLPVMVGAIQTATGEITGVHRTFLKADGSGKAPISSPRMMLGDCIANAVRFASPGPKLAVGEGIETCLSVAQEYPSLPVWAALSTGGLKAIVLPEHIREVVILADADEPGEQAAQAAAQRFLREGRRCKIARPSNGHKDFNDTLRASSSEATVQRVANDG